MLNHMIPVTRDPGDMCFMPKYVPERRLPHLSARKASGRGGAKGSFTRSAMRERITRIPIVSPDSKRLASKTREQDTRVRLPASLDPVTGWEGGSSRRAFLLPLLPDDSVPAWEAGTAAGGGGFLRFMAGSGTAPEPRSP